jgi:copper transport protein
MRYERASTIRRRWVRLPAVAVLVGVFVVGTAGPASAHAVLLNTNPPDGATYSRSSPPTVASMHFGEPVGAHLGSVRVYDERGSLLESGAPTHPHGDGSTVNVRLPHLSRGAYVVTWRVISADTHPVTGAFTFTVGTGKDVGTLATRLLSSQNGASNVGVLYGVMRFAILTSLLVLVGAVAFLVLAWPAGRRMRAAERVVKVAWWLALGSTIAGFLVEGVYAAAFPLRDVLRWTVVSDTAHSRYGEMAILRAGLLLACLPLLRVLFRQHDENAGDPASPPRSMSAVGAVLAVGLAATVTFAGHATTGRWVPGAELADVIHVLAAGLWIGGLVMLLAAALRGADDRTLDRIVPRFSTIALVAVAAIVVTGAFQAVRQVGSFSALRSTDYGQLLIVKLVAFGALVGLAFMSRGIVKVWYRAGERERAELQFEYSGVGGAGGRAPSATAADRTAANLEPGFEPPASWARRRLRSTVGLEVCVAVVVLVVTALLVDARPAYEAANGPAIMTLKTPKLWFYVEIIPAKVGPNQFHLTTSTATGGVADPLEMSMQLSNPSHHVGPLKVPLIRAGPGHMLTNGYTIPFGGEWQVTVTAVVTDVDEVSATQTLTVH